MNYQFLPVEVTKLLKREQSKMTKDDLDIEVLNSEDTFTDHVAARADAFGQLALRMEEIADEKVRELCFQMLRQLIRSIKTPPDAEVTSITGGKP